MSLLPGQIIPQSIPIGKTANGDMVSIDHDWWLFFYNLALGTLSPTPGGTAVSDMEKILLNEIDSRVSDTTGGPSGGSGTVTTFSFTNANGFTGTVTNASTTPNLTLSSSFMVNPMTTQGDIIIENATPAPDRLAIGTAGQLLSVVSGLPGWVTNPGVFNIQTFGAGTWTWTKPSGVGFTCIIAIGNGGNGGNGHNSATYLTAACGGGGGGSGSYSVSTFPTSFLPSTLNVFVAAGGSGATPPTYVSLASGGPASDRFVAAPGGANGANGTTSGNAAGGAAGSQPNVSSQVLSTLAWGNNTISGPGNGGTSGGNIGSTGTSIQFAVSGIMTCGGTGAGSTPTTTSTTGGAGGPQNAISGTAITNNPGGTAGTTSGGAGGNGVDGSDYPFPGLFYPRGGTGGGATGVSSLGLSSTSGNGGKGATGCGGGGGAGGIGGNGTGGAGGDGVIIIISW